MAVKDWWINRDWWLTHGFVSQGKAADVSPSHSTLPASPNSHFRFHGCILHTQTCCAGTRGRGNNRDRCGRNKPIITYYAVFPLALTLETCLFSMRWIKKKHDACEAAENGGGVRQAGRHASEREWRGERRRGGRRGTARASFAMGEESIVWGDWLSRSVASPPVRGSSEDAPLNWEGIHSLGVCIESSAITSCKDRDSAAEAFSTPSALLLFSSLSCSHELSASSSLGQHVHLQPAQWLHARSPEAWPCSASFTCHQHPCQVSHSWAHTSSHFPCSGRGNPSHLIPPVLASLVPSPTWWSRQLPRQGWWSRLKSRHPKKFKILLVIDEPQQEVVRKSSVWILHMLRVVCLLRPCWSCLALHGSFECSS